MEREISIRELLWKIVFSWKNILLFAIVFGILAGVGTYIRDQNLYQSRLEVEPAEELSEEEWDQIREAKKLQEWEDNNREYLENSILLNVDPYNKYVLTLKYYVDSDYYINYLENNYGDYTGSVTAAYCYFAKSEDMVKQIMTQLEMNCEPFYIRELISTASGDINSIFTVEVIYPEEDDLNEISNIITRVLESKSTLISENIGEHSLILLSQEVSREIDLNLIDKQQDVVTIGESYTEQIEALKASMTERQLNILENNDIEEEIEIIKPTLNVENVVLGMFLGAFLGVMWKISKVILSGKLQFPYELSQIFGLSPLGIYRIQKKKGMISRWLYSMKYRNEGPLFAEETIDFICANLEMLCKRENLQQLYCCGTQMKAVEKSLLDAVREKMEGVGIIVSYLDDIRHDPITLKRASEGGSIILIEQVEMSDYQEIKEELGILKREDVKILGYICIDE